MRSVVPNPGMVVFRVVSEVMEVLQTGLLDADFADGDAQLLHQMYGIGIGAVCRSKPRHGNANNPSAALSQPVEGTYTGQQGKG